MVMADGLHDVLVDAEFAGAVDEVPEWVHACKVADEELQTSNCAIRAVACTGDFVITGSSRPVLKVWAVAEAKLEKSRELSHGAVGSSCVEVARDGCTAAVCSDDGGIGLYDLRANKRLGELKSDIPVAWKAKFLHDGRSLASGGPSGAVCFWDLGERSLVSEIAADGAASLPKGDEDFPPTKRQKDGSAAGRHSKRSHGGAQESAGGAKAASPVYSLAVSDDGRLLGCGRCSGDVSVMRVAGRDWAGDVRAHYGEGSSIPVRALAFDPHSKLLLSGGDDHHVGLLDARGWARPRADGEAAARMPQLERFSAHRGWVTSVNFCPDTTHRLALTTSWDATVKLWDYSTHGLLHTYKEHKDSVFGAAFQPSGAAGIGGKFFVTVGADALIALYARKG